MSIRAGQILHAMNRFIIDRIQTGGPGNLNIPTEKIYELGNFQSVAIVRDVPDLTFNLEAMDVSTEVEALLTGVDPATVTSGQEFLLSGSVPIDITSPWKSTQNAYDIVRGVAVPHLTLESASYRYGLNDNATQQFSLRGDSIYYVPGSVTVQTETADGATTTYGFEVQTTNATGTTGTAVSAIRYVEQGSDIFALNVSVDGARQVPGDDYTDTATGITFLTAPANGAEIRITFGFDPADVGGETYPQTVHQGIAVKPAAIKGKDIKVYVGLNDDTATPNDLDLWSDVQSVTVDWSVSLEDDFEFGNPRAVAREATDAPEVTGSIELKPFSPAAFFEKLHQITGVPTDQVIGPQSSVTLPLEIRLLNPDSGGAEALAKGAVIKTLYIPDARFTIPGFEGSVQSKLTTTLNFESDTGVLSIYSGWSGRGPAPAFTA